LYGTEGDDDDCKYHVKIEVPALCEGKQAVIKLTLTSKSTNKGVTGAAPELETTLDGAAGPIADESTEKGDGVYEVPALFDKPGRWVGKFHFFETCSDTPEDSPHGHAGFFFQVP
ncbi:MAG TPA: FixH family protein, partial [Polyangiaceae bacterium]|nr:FixH family protein [Polyangiaceae bacterium]